VKQNSISNPFNCTMYYIHWVSFPNIYVSLTEVLYWPSIIEAGLEQIIISVVIVAIRFMCCRSINSLLCMYVILVIKAVRTQVEFFCTYFLLYYRWSFLRGVCIKRRMYVCISIFVVRTLSYVILLDFNLVWVWFLPRLWNRTIGIIVSAFPDILLHCQT